MDLETLGGIAEIMQKYGLTHVSATVEGEKVKLDRADPDAPSPAVAPAAAGSPVVMVPYPAGAPSGAPAVPAVPAVPAAAAGAGPAVVASPAPTADEGVTQVEAPMVGVFYAAPSPGAEPFVHVGSKVHRGDTLCIMEAMKCMNEVQAEVDGTVVDICASDGELVEYGRCLMKIS